MNAASHILQYLKGTHHYQLNSGWNDCAKLIGYSDLDWAADTDDCRSTTGYCYTLTGACIAWQTCKQCTVALSSMEAEYMALTRTAKHGQWAIQLLQQLNFEVSTIRLYSNSLGAHAIAENPFIIVTPNTSKFNTITSEMPCKMALSISHLYQPRTILPMH